MGIDFRVESVAWPFGVIAPNLLHGKAYAVERERRAFVPVSKAFWIEKGAEPAFDLPGLAAQIMRDANVPGWVLILDADQISHGWHPRRCRRVR